MDSVPMTPKRRGIRRTHQRLRAEVQSLIKAITKNQAAINALRKRCQHPVTVRHPRTVAEAPGWNECLDCGAEVDD